MEEITKLITDFGFTVALSIGVLLLSFKYIPKWLDYVLNRAKEKDYMMDNFKSVIDNNTEVIRNNTEVIKLNSTTIKNYTDNAHKLEQHISELTKIVEITNRNVELLKETRR